VEAVFLALIELEIGNGNLLRFANIALTNLQQSFDLVTLGLESTL
jgi:hypothetical protein